MACTVYPRRYGEHYHFAFKRLFYRGLSPQVRGTLYKSNLLAQGMRFIPAGTGNTIIDKIFCDHRSVYPRRYGEHVNAAMTANPIGVYPRRYGEHITT